MSFAKNPQNINKTGRPKGAVDKDTRRIREAYQLLLENNLDNLTMWLEEIGKQSPEKAFNMMLKLSEFVVPKLARKELSGVDGASLFSAVQFKFGDTIEE